MNEDGEREWVVSQLLFADDTALVAESAEQLQCLVREFGRVCKRRKLRVNVDKSEVMSVGESDDPAILNIMLNGGRMEVVNSFKFLGSCFSSEGEVKGDVSTKLQSYGIFCFKINKKAKIENSEDFISSNFQSVSVLKRM